MMEGRLGPSQPSHRTWSVDPACSEAPCRRKRKLVGGSVNCVSGSVLDMLPDTMFPATSGIAAVRAGTLVFQTKWLVLQAVAEVGLHGLPQQPTPVSQL